MCIRDRCVCVCVCVCGWVGVMAGGSSRLIDQDESMQSTNKYTLHTTQRWTASRRRWCRRPSTSSWRPRSAPPSSSPTGVYATRFCVCVYMCTDGLDWIRAVNWLTCLLITHRHPPKPSLSTIRNADAICVVFNGRIVEQGTHDELIARPDSQYSMLCRMSG